MALKIDINCDAGEGFGAWKMGKDSELIRYVSSINIACGFHAGDATTMRKTVALALHHQVKIGAHPSFPDLQGFGRREMQLSNQEIYDICLYQIGALAGITKALGGKLHHVKPHGAMYNQAAKTPEMAEVIARATKDFDETLVLYGLSGSCLLSEAEKIGLQTASEVFADRTYQNDGSLTPRSEANALLYSTEEALLQARQFIDKQPITTVEGKQIHLKAETICIHGDGASALSYAKAIWEIAK